MRVSFFLWKQRISKVPERERRQLLWVSIGLNLLESYGSTMAEIAKKNPKTILDHFSSLGPSETLLPETSPSQEFCLGHLRPFWPPRPSSSQRLIVFPILHDLMNLPDFFHLLDLPDLPEYPEPVDFLIFLYCSHCSILTMKWF